MEQRDLRETVFAAREGDAHAFETLFARHLPRLVSFIRLKAGSLVTGRESVHDIAQSVCREVLQDAAEFEYRGETAFRNWLFLHATRKIVDRARFYRQQRRDVAAERALPESSSAEAKTLLDCYASIATPSRHAAAREELQRIEDALWQLPESQRDAVAMSRLMGLGYAQIAEQMATSEAAVRGLVARGLARLSALLRDR